MSSFDISLTFRVMSSIYIFLTSRWKPLCCVTIVTLLLCYGHDKAPDSTVTLGSPERFVYIGFEFEPSLQLIHLYQYSRALHPPVLVGIALC